MRLAGGDSNRDGIGARIRVTAGGRAQTQVVRSGGSYLSHNDMRAHFGLGEAGLVERVQIWWPSGREDDLAGLAVDRFYLVAEGTGRAVVVGGGS